MSGALNNSARCSYKLTSRLIFRNCFGASELKASRELSYVIEGPFERIQKIKHVIDPTNSTQLPVNGWKVYKVSHFVNQKMKEELIDYLEE